MNFSITSRRHTTVVFYGGTRNVDFSALLASRVASFRSSGFMKDRFHQQTIGCDMAKPAEPWLHVVQRTARQPRAYSNKDRKADNQLSLFPNRYDITELAIDCEISSRHLFGLDDIFAMLNDMHNFNPKELSKCLQLSDVSESDIDDLSRTYNATTKSTLSKLMLVLGMKG